MISWTIPATPITLTASSSETSSSSSALSNSYLVSRSWSNATTSSSGNGLTLSSESGSTTNSYSSESSYSASTGLSGITTARTTQYTSFNSVTGSFFYGFEGGGTLGGPGGGTFSTSGSSSESGTQGYDVYNVQTSTTETYTVPAGTTKTVSVTETFFEEEQVFNSFWTTTSTGDSNNSSVAFITQNKTSRLDYETEYSTRGATRTVATTLTDTQTAGPQATVIRADDTEVLYHISSPATTWNGYLVASDAATTATRVTLYPSYSTQPVSVVAATSTTSTAVNSLVSQSISWKISSAIAATATTVNRNYLPNQTGTVASNRLTTGSTSRAVTVFSAETLSYGNGNQRTMEVTSYGTAPAVVSRQIADLTYETTVTATVSATRKVLCNNAVTNSTTYSSSTSTGSSDSQETNSSGETHASASANSYAANQTVLGPAMVTLAQPQTINRSRYETSGAALGSQSGGWMTYAGAELYVGTLIIGTDSVSFGTAYNGSYTNAVTLFPTSNSQVSISGKTITINSSESTSSYEIGLSGSTSTFQQSDSVSHFGGGPLANGCTVIKVAGPGAYKDRAGKSTTSFNGAATVLTQGQSAPIRVWQTVQNIGPLELRSARHGLTFTEARNDVALPPA